MSILNNRKPLFGPLRRRIFDLTRGGDTLHEKKVENVIENRNPEREPEMLKNYIKRSAEFLGVSDDEVRRSSAVEEYKRKLMG